MDEPTMDTWPDEVAGRFRFIADPAVQDGLPPRPRSVRWKMFAKMALRRFGLRFDGWLALEQQNAAEAK